MVYILCWYTLFVIIINIIIIINIRHEVDFDRTFLRSLIDPWKVFQTVFLHPLYNLYFTIILVHPSL